MSERQGIEIDYCPKCRGVWLDRGELDKFVTQSERQLPSKSFKSEPFQTETDRSTGRSLMNRESLGHSQHDRHRRDDDDEADGFHSQRGRKKESFWGDLFDFG